MMACKNPTHLFNVERHRLRTKAPLSIYNNSTCGICPHKTKRSKTQTEKDTPHDTANPLIRKPNPPKKQGTFVNPHSGV
jgi:hypothetical protein